MVDEYGYLEDEDMESQVHTEDDQESQFEGNLSPGGRRETIGRIFGDDIDTLSDEEGLGAQDLVSKLLRIFLN